MNDQTPLARVRAFQRAANPNGDYHWPAEEAANVGGVPLYFDDIESLAATDELDVVEVAIRRLREAEADRDRLAARVAELEALAAGDELNVTLDGLIDAAHRRRPGFDGDVRAVAAVAVATARMWPVPVADQELRQELWAEALDRIDDLYARFADRIAVLEQRDTAPTPKDGS